MGVRAVLGYDKQLCARAVSAFVAELSRSLRRRAARGVSVSGERATRSPTFGKRSLATAVVEWLLFEKMPRAWPSGRAWSIS